MVIATRRRARLLAETLASLTACRPGPEEVLVVDGDPDESARPVVEAVQQRAPELNISYELSRPGLPTQRNRGMALVSGDVVVFADDDVEFEPDLFAVLREAYRDSTVVGATPRIVEPEVRRVGNSRSFVRRLLPGGGGEGTMTRFGYPRRVQDVERARDVEYMLGCLMSARRELAAELEFDEGLEPPNGYALAEDEDFSYRLSRRGRVRYLPETVVRHKTTGSRSMNRREFNRQVVVNRTYLFRKNFRQTPLARAQFALLLVIFAVHRAVNREWDGVRGLADGALEAWRPRRWRRGK